MKWVLIGLIKIYRKFISPCIGPSLYLYADLLPVRHGSDQKYGAIKRYLSCLQADSAMSPVAEGGYDPVHKTPGGKIWF